MIVATRELIAQVKAHVSTVPPAEAARRIAGEADLLVLDVREPEEHARAALPKAVNLPRGLLEIKMGQLCADPERRIRVHCAAGARAVLAARTLQEMGFLHVVAVDGSFGERYTPCR